jgi:hypothetical protein
MEQRDAASFSFDHNGNKFAGRRTNRWAVFCPVTQFYTPGSAPGRVSKLCSYVLDTSVRLRPISFAVIPQADAVSIDGRYFRPEVLEALVSEMPHSYEPMFAGVLSGFFKKYSVFLLVIKQYQHIGVLMPIRIHYENWAEIPNIPFLPELSLDNFSHLHGDTELI